MMPRLEEQDYTYFTTVRGMCRQCRQVVPARVFFRGGQVWQQSLCPTCPADPALICGDQQWYLNNVLRPRPDRAPLDAARTSRFGCPHDCGPCVWHASPCQLPIVSITNACNLRCPICFTYNRADSVYHMPPEELRGILDWIVRSSGPVDLVNITGGEPTLHPNLLDLLRLCRRPEIGRVTMNSNGLRLAEDAALCHELAALGVYVILSLNTLDHRTSQRLHGRDLVDVKLRAIENLTRAGAKMTLLNVMIRGENEDAAAELLGLLRSNDNILSLTVQTMTYTGQGGGTFPRARHIPVDEAARIVAEHSDGQIRLDDFVTRPAAHPLCYLTCFLVKDGDRLHPVARLAPREQLEKLLGDSYLIRPGQDDRVLRDAINQLYAEGRDAELAVLRGLVERLFPAGRPLDDFQRQQVAEAAVRTIYVHAHMDEDTFDCSRAMLCPDLVPAEPGRLIPACTYNLLYRRQDARFFSATGSASADVSATGYASANPAAPDTLSEPVPCPATESLVSRETHSLKAARVPPETTLAEPVAPRTTLGITQSSCDQCRRIVPAKITSDGHDVYFEKLCPEHGQRRVLVHRDLEDYVQSLRYVKPAWIPREHYGRSDVPCPEGCGLCDRHEQHLCMPIVEITARCDLRCPICLVDAGRSWDMSMDEFRHILDGLVRAERQIDVLNLSGGEPLMHPGLIALLDEALARPEIVRVSLSTNGLRLLEQPHLLSAIRQRNVVVSLQLDGFDDSVDLLLRGRHLADQKRAILARLADADASTSLTVTLAGGVNEGQLPALLDYFFAHRHVVSMMVQPLAFAGRGQDLAGRARRLTIPDVVQLLAQAGHPRVAAADFTPIPCAHPLCMKLAYYLVLPDGHTTSMRQLVDASRLLDTLANRTIIGLDPQDHRALKDLVYDLWTGPAGSIPEGEAVMATLRGILDGLSASCSCSGFDPRQLFLATERRLKSIFIHAFQDPDTFDLARVRRCCHSYPQSDGTLVPVCVHNVLRRNNP